VVPRTDHPRWWDVRRAQNRKPASYRCPLCGEMLPALSEHVLLKPEGEATGRRHAHLSCVMAARKAGKLPTRDEWEKAQKANSPPEPRPPGRGRLFDRFRRAP
jgi:hypothetical protein